MEERRNNRKVENRLKDALRHDRARIQVGRISHFGLLEMSRQRLRTGVLEGSTTQCPHCQGTGIIRSVELVALAVLRALEDHLLRDARSSLTAVTTAGRRALHPQQQARLRHRYGTPLRRVDHRAGQRPHAGRQLRHREIGGTGSAPQTAAERSVVNMEWGFEGQEAEEEQPPRRRWNNAKARLSRGRRQRQQAPGAGGGAGRGRRDDRPEHRARGDEAGDPPRNGGAEELWRGTDEGELQPKTHRRRHGGEPLPGSGEQPHIAGESDGEERRRAPAPRGRRGGRRGRDRDGERSAHGEGSGAHEDEHGDAAMEADAEARAGRGTGTALARRSAGRGRRLRGVMASPSMPRSHRTFSPPSAAWSTPRPLPNNATMAGAHARSEPVPRGSPQGTCCRASARGPMRGLDGAVTSRAPRLVAEALFRTSNRQTRGCAAAPFTHSGAARVGISGTLRPARLVPGSGAMARRRLRYGGTVDEEYASSCS